MILLESGLTRFESGMVVGDRHKGQTISETLRELNLPKSTVSRVSRI